MTLPEWAWNDTTRRVARHFIASLLALLSFSVISAILHRLVTEPPELVAYLAFLDKTVLVAVATGLAFELLYGVIMDVVAVLGKHGWILA